jgi:hypothetical protein
LFQDRERPTPSVVLALPLELRFIARNDPLNVLSVDLKSCVFHITNDPLQVLSSDHSSFVYGSRTSSSYHFARSLLYVSVSASEAQNRLAPSFAFGPPGYLLQSRKRLAPSFVFGPNELCFRVQNNPLHALSWTVCDLIQGR